MKMSTAALASETGNVWMDKWRYDDAEAQYQMIKLGYCPAAAQNEVKQKTSSSLVSEIAKARQHIQKSLRGEGEPQVDNILVSRLESLELDNKDLRKVTEDLQAVVKKLESRIVALEAGSSAPKVESKKEEKTKAEEADDDDDDFDLFGSDEEDDEEQEKIKAERVAAYQQRKGKKPGLIAKSNVILDVKPWDDETDMKKLEECVRSIKMDGLFWGTGKFVEIGYGIKKLVISSVIEDEKVSMEDVEEQIVAFEDYIQSMDIAAFNKI